MVNYLIAAVGIAFFADDVETRLPAFDLEQTQASYVVSLPKSYDKSRPWPLIVDFHGAISPRSKGANVTRARLWSKFVDRADYIVVGLNGRTRAWGMTKTEQHDKAYALAVLKQVRERFNIDPQRIHLAGFSSGSDFLCKSNLQLEGPFGGSLVVCPGPSSVVGLRNGELLKAQAKPFYFVAGEEDYIRKNGAWEAFRALDKVGARVMYREVPRVGHAFPAVEEYVRLVQYLEQLPTSQANADQIATARAALEREDFLLASTHLLRSKMPAAKTLLAQIEEQGQTLVSAAKRIDAQTEPGRAYEAWWRIRTQFFRFEDMSREADKQLKTLSTAISARDMYRARREWFAKRRTAEPARNPQPRSTSTTPAPPIPTPQKPIPTPQKPTTSRPIPQKPATRPSVLRRPRELPPWEIGGYLDYEQLTNYLKQLAQQHPGRARLLKMGESIEGRALWVLELTDSTTGAADSKPAAYLQGGIHGNEISATMTTLYMAWQLAANPSRSRTVDRTLRNYTVYIAPAVNPDAVQHFMAEPHSHWRPRYNYRPFDEDGDGKVDEDPYEDLDGDGEIGLMYRRDDEQGVFILKDGRVVRGAGTPRYVAIGREGTDNDGDGKYSEDRPGGVDLNRNFSVGFATRSKFGGSSGVKAASEPETRAIVDFVTQHRNISLFLDYHNNAQCVFYWNRGEHAADMELFQSIAARAEAELNYPPKHLTHSGAGLAIAWAYGELGLLSFIVELESGRQAPAEYFAKVWKNDVFIKATPFRHPQLGDVLIGNDVKKLPKRNPHPSDIVWQADRNWMWVREQLQQLPRLQLVNPKIAATETGFVVSGEVVNSGNWPTDTARAVAVQRDFPIRLSAEGAELSGAVQLGSLAAKQARSFRVELSNPRDSVTLIVNHPRGGTVRLPVVRPRQQTRPVRREYKIAEGYATPDRAVLANNKFYKQGRTEQERGPAFELKHRKDELRVAVLLGEWHDQRHSIDATEFEKAFFSEHTYTTSSATGQRVYGSLRDFYDEMSYGRLQVTGKVFDWLQLPGNYADYRDASFGSSVLRDQLLLAIRREHGADVFDEFDGLAFVWAGNTVRRTSALWPMRLTLKELPGKVAFKMGEFHLGEMAAIGVACHEMGHTFGVNDKYGLGATANPIGPWCLMAKGTHGGEPSGRHRPFHLCAWCKMVIGWVQPAVIDPSRPQKLALRPISFGAGEAFRILLKPDGSEYILLENRRREGFHTDLPSPGLVVIRVGPNDLPSAPQTRMQLLTAHGLPPLGRGLVADPQRVAWPQPGKNEIAVDDVRLADIRLVDDVVYFQVKRMQ